MDIFDTVIIGGGHAGVEAAFAVSRLGRKAALLSHDSKRIGALSCNPAVGGQGKGHLVKEIDALGGLIGLASDKSAIQFRRLNTRKGPAVRATRCQVDRIHYRNAIQKHLLQQNNLEIIAGEAVKLKKDKTGCFIITFTDHSTIKASSVVVTTGTFLNGQVHIGQLSFPAGRLGDSPSRGLSESLIDFGFELGRLKTGTPPRILAKTVDFSKMSTQPGDTNPRMFSILSKGTVLPQVPCHITRTTEQTHELIRSGLNRSAMYSGRISGVGARYCPSIEDKIVRFADKPSHHIFVEPEGLASGWVYPNGISTSLPLDIQEAVVKSLPGMENAEIVRPGYAIEYDYANPTQLTQSLMAKSTPGLFLAGQINGTSGYEEAAAQGLIAGVNAVRYLQNKNPLILTRDQAYIAVMIDDLTTLGVNEPYRMFTSRAEYRLLLREDNAAERLTPAGRELGLVSDGQWRLFESRRVNINKANDTLIKSRIAPTLETNRQLTNLKTSCIIEPVSAIDLLKRPEICINDIYRLIPEFELLSDEAAEALEVEIKYQGYVAKQKEQVQRFIELEKKSIPDSIEYEKLAGLSIEMIEKLSKIKPRSIGQAARIPGVTPAALMIISVYAQREKERAA